MTRVKAKIEVKTEVKDEVKAKIVPIKPKVGRMEGISLALVLVMVLRLG